MDSGAGYLNEGPIYDLKSERNEDRHLEKIDEAYIKVIRKFRKRAELQGGYKSLPELWLDFAPIILKTIHLKSSPVQRLLTYTGDFHEFCDAFKEDTDLHEYKEYFEAMDFAWCTILAHSNVSATDRVRIINVLRDGQDRASKLGLQEVYAHATDKADDDED
ncbi:hypothetical protein INT47_008884 [Mucor saturninus]|uniref:Uncharacterized protein n=1 Tax=Mucor saturninus TaxID=64648 RepID=A0A8H7R1A1_9FUNG|nr:hypothetical protein INT47_008884 [Mucor saturninus]